MMLPRLARNKSLLRHSPLYYGGGHLINLLRGAGFESKASLNVDFDRFNFLLPSLRGIIANRSAYTVHQGEFPTSDF
jgi:hypothetical protein